MADCKHGNSAPDATLNDIHENQGGLQRHKCAVCAYERGYELGKTGETFPSGSEICDLGATVTASLVSELPDSQGTTGRHKCCLCAVKAGYDRGGSVTLTAP